MSAEASSGEPTGGGFLDLLVAEAAADAFEQVVEDARRDGASPERLAALRDELVKALRVRAVLEERRRREQELAALYETASDLTSLREVDLVLSAIVRRARQLLGTDTAYLMLIDEQRGDTYMRITEGTVTPDYQQVRLDLGTGLGGLVAKTASPYYTANYLADDRFEHTPDVDEAVSGEGIVAILGVPLKLGDDVIGVLFAANRRERPFAAEEVNLLQSLAAHAAVAIDNARLFTEVRQALADLEAATAQARAHSLVVERAATAHERLTALVLEGGGIADVTRAVAELFDGALLVVDADGRLLAGAGSDVDELHKLAVDQGSLPRSHNAGRAVRAGLAEVLESGRTSAADMPDDVQRRWLAPVIAGSERLGALVLGHDDDLDQADLRTLERAALVTALVLLNERAVAEAEQRVRGELLEDLFSESPSDVERLRRRAQLLAVELDTPHAVVAVAPPPEHRRQALIDGGAIAGELGGLAGEHRGRLLLLLPDLDGSTAARQVARRLGVLLDAPVTAAGSGPAAGPTQLATAYQEASRCLRVLQALGREGEAAGAEELGAYALLLSGSEPDDVQRFVARTLGPVLDYDSRRGTDLCGTLEAYFALQGNVTQAAGRLHVHPNTVYQRMERITRLLGEGWSAGDGALQVQLALRLHRLRDAL